MIESAGMYPETFNWTGPDPVHHCVHQCFTKSLAGQRGINSKKRQFALTGRIEVQFKHADIFIIALY